MQQITDSYRRQMVFDVYPDYLQDIVRAMIQEGANEDGNFINLSALGLKFRPKSDVYFSNIMQRAENANPEKHNPSLREYFGFVITRDAMTGILVGVIYNKERLMKRDIIT
jgi:hypothetical protein